jgi:hypothetical protein
MSSRYYKSYVTTPQCGTNQRWNWCVKACVPKASLMPDCPPPDGYSDPDPLAEARAQGDFTFRGLDKLGIPLPWLLAGGAALLVVILLVTRK